MRYFTFGRYIFLCCLCMFSHTVKSQNDLVFSVKNASFISTNNQIPFWFHANQHGKIQSANQFLNTSDVSILKSSTSKIKNNLKWDFGGDLIYAIAQDDYFQINQAFIGISLKGWELKGGLFYDPIHYAGLSSTNGNLVRSGNARPYPNLRFCNTEYKPLSFIAKWLYFKLEFDEGFLDDDRYVNNTHLHHKSAYLLIKPKESWDATFGVEHYVMWGGTSKDPEIGRFPMSIGQYMRYIFSIPGGSSNSPEHDKGNVSGNHVSTYQLAYSKHLTTVDLTLYLSHPFENHPGLTWKNWPDNLIGAHVRFKDQTKLINNVVYEIINTRHQNLTNEGVTNEGDEKWMHDLYEDYFVHLLYRSGFTYHQNVMGSPLFLPVVERKDEMDNNWFSLRSNRFFAHHLGISGNFTKSFRWKGLLTYMEHFGTFPYPYKLNHRQLSGICDIRYINNNFPVELGLSLAFDSGISENNNLGLQFSVTKRW